MTKDTQAPVTPHDFELATFIVNGCSPFALSKQSLQPLRSFGGIKNDTAAARDTARNTSPGDCFS